MRVCSSLSAIQKRFAAKKWTIRRTRWDIPNPLVQFFNDVELRRVPIGDKAVHFTRFLGWFVVCFFPSDMFPHFVRRKAALLADLAANKVEILLETGITSVQLGEKRVHSTSIWREESKPNWARPALLTLRAFLFDSLNCSKLIF